MLTEHVYQISRSQRDMQSSRSVDEDSLSITGAIYECYQVSISSPITVNAADSSSVTWYCLKVVRTADMVQNAVHRYLDSVSKNTCIMIVAL